MVPMGGLLGLPTPRASTLEARKGLEKLRRVRNTKGEEGMPKKSEEGWKI